MYWPLPLFQLVKSPRGSPLPRRARLPRSLQGCRERLPAVLVALTSEIIPRERCSYVMAWSQSKGAAFDRSLPRPRRVDELVRRVKSSNETPSFAATPGRNPSSTISDRPAKRCATSRPGSDFRSRPMRIMPRRACWSQVPLLAFVDDMVRRRRRGCPNSANNWAHIGPGPCRSRSRCSFRPAVLVRGRSC